MLCWIGTMLMSDERVFSEYSLKLWFQSQSPWAVDVRPWSLTCMNHTTSHKTNLVQVQLLWHVFIQMQFKVLYMVIKSSKYYGTYEPVGEAVAPISLTSESFFEHSNIYYCEHCTALCISNTVCTPTILCTPERALWAPNSTAHIQQHYVYWCSSSLVDEKYFSP